MRNVRERNVCAKRKVGRRGTVPLPLPKELVLELEAWSPRP